MLISANSAAIRMAFMQGEVFAYPTEAVFGLGCDPDNEVAVHKILAVKQRPVEKGMILIADNYSQLLPYVDDQAIPPQLRTSIFSSWPGHNTWLLPKNPHTPYFLSGDSELIAVRVSAHPGVKQLCQHLGKPLVSTSANPAGVEPALNHEQLRQYFGSQLLVIEGELGGAHKPSIILHGLTGQIMRD